MSLLSPSATFITVQTVFLGHDWPGHNTPIQFQVGYAVITISDNGIRHDKIYFYVTFIQNMTDCSSRQKLSWHIAVGEVVSNIK